MKCNNLFGKRVSLAVKKKSNYTTAKEFAASLATAHKVP